MWVVVTEWMVIMASNSQVVQDSAVNMPDKQQKDFGNTGRICLVHFGMVMLLHVHKEHNIGCTNNSEMHRCSWVNLVAQSHSTVFRMCFGYLTKNYLHQHISLEYSDEFDN